MIQLFFIHKYLYIFYLAIQCPYNTYQHVKYVIQYSIIILLNKKKVFIEQNTNNLYSQALDSAWLSLLLAMMPNPYKSCFKETDFHLRFIIE